VVTVMVVDSAPTLRTALIVTVCMASTTTFSCKSDLNPGADTSTEYWPGCRGATEK